MKKITLNLKFINNYLVHYIWRRLLPRYLSFTETTKVLECGLGVGKLMSLMENWFPRSVFWGMDIDFDAICAAREVTKKTALVVASAESLPFASQEFDLLMSMHVIEHLPQPPLYISEAYRVMQPGGILVVAAPNPEGMAARLMGDRWPGFHPEHVSLYPPGKWRALLQDQGFTILRDGTTGLSTLPIVRRSPLCLLNWGLLFLFGIFPWRHGDAYIAICSLK